jgi:HK97 family phage portal protein
MTVRKQRRVAVASKRRQPRAAGRIRVPPPNWFLLSPLLQEAGVYVTPETASQVAAVYGCCRLIVDCLAPSPIVVSEITGGGVRQDRPDDPIAWTLNYGAQVALAPDAPTAQAVEEALYWAALLGDGNGYAEIQRDMSGRFFGLWPIDPSRVTPRRDETGFYYEVSQYNGGPARVEAMDMFHLRGPSLFGWVGDSVIYRASKAIGIAHASQVYSAAYFANGTAISGLLSSDKNITPAQAKAAKELWKDEHGGGPSRAHGISVMGQGVKYQAINHTAQEAMLIESRRFQVAEIARFFGVPTTLLADNEAWTNLGELYLGFYRNALRPWAERFDAEASRKLFPQRQPWREVTHDLTHLTLGSFKDQVSALSQATGNKPMLTQNEARALFGRNSMPGCDDLKPLVSAPKPAFQPKPTDPMEPDEDDPEEDPPRRGVSARDALAAMFADAFGRHLRRVKNRRADLKRDLTEAEAEAMRTKLVEDCGAALALARRGGASEGVDLTTYASALDAGEPPDKAADRLVAALWSEKPAAVVVEPAASALAEAVQSGLLAVGAGLAGRAAGEAEFVRDGSGQVTGLKFKN